MGIDVKYSRVVFRPFSFLYFALLVFLYLSTISMVTVFLRQLLVQEVGVPPEAFSAVMFVSLFGSFINIPLTSVESLEPMTVQRDVRLFWVRWRIPEVVMGIRRTQVFVNLGGAVVPVVISLYLLLVSIPSRSLNVLASYLRVIAVLVIVSYFVHRSARLVKGLGIATPAFGPPLITALAVMLVDFVSPLNFPVQVAYVGGTLGTLIGADLLNIRKLPKLGAPVVSIGGAGTFDGIYITGLISVLLVLLFL